jgi:hypothetical protein
MAVDTEEFQVEAVLPKQFIRLMLLADSWVKGTL